MVRSSSGCVAGLTAAALAAIGFLAYRASAYAPADLGVPRAVEASSVTAPRAAGDGEHPTALPAGSGTGRRVVYSLGGNRVWLVERGGRVLRTFLVSPGTVDPPPARYTVTSRSNSVVGSDGVAVEHVVRFAALGGIAIGFSAPTDGRVTVPDTRKKLGGIRESREDATAMWHFATIGTPVKVTP